MRANAGTADSIGAALNNSLREPLCLKLIDAWMAVARRQPDARHKLEHADSLAMEAHEIANVEAPIIVARINVGIVARMWESLGELPRALTAYRHRYYHYSVSPVAAAWIAREEGRLATLAGDKQGAIRAYRRFLAMRPNPEAQFSS